MTFERRERRWASSAALVLTMCCAAAGARADDDLRALRVRFAQGEELERVGRWADALDRFEAVAKARSTPEVEFHLAFCLEKLGRLVRAESLFRRARDDARTTSAVVVEEAQQHLADLEARVPHVTLVLPARADDVALRIDDHDVRAGVAVALDPGPHVAVATRKGAVVAAAAFATADRQSKIIALPIVEPAPPRALVAKR